jgi:hypothetical protein
LFLPVLGRHGLTAVTRLPLATNAAICGPSDRLPANVRHETRLAWDICAAFTVDSSGYECSRGNHYSHFHRTLLTATNPVRDFTDAAMSFVAETLILIRPMRP